MTDTPRTDDQMREEFEAWYESHLWDSMPPMAYTVWQAACRAQAKRDVEICKNIAERYDGNVYRSPMEENRAVAARVCAQEIEKEAGL